MDFQVRIGKEDLYLGGMGLRIGFAFEDEVISSGRGYLDLMAWVAYRPAKGSCHQTLGIVGKHHIKGSCTHSLTIFLREPSLHWPLRWRFCIREEEVQMTCWFGIR
jgi:hypothetical protein